MSDDLPARLRAFVGPYLGDGIHPNVTRDEIIAEIERLRAERDALRAAVRWALGYDEGDPDFSEIVNDSRKYAWRIELRRRAGSGIDAALAQTGANDVDR